MSKLNPPYVMTIDAGTGSGRALIFDSSGNVLSVAQREWTLAPDPRYPGSAVFDTTHAWHLICECAREAVARSGLASDQISAVTATSMREGMVLYDAGRREIWACPNIDARAREEADRLVADGTAEVIYDNGGDWVGIISPPRFRWLARHEPALFERMRHVSMISDWVLMRLSGELATDHSCGSSSGLFDLARGEWSAEVIKRLELPPAIFPPVCNAGSQLGKVTAAAAADTGLRPGTPVVIGGADTQLALLGSGGTAAGRLTVVGGTFWQTAWLADRPLIDRARRVRTLCHVLPGLWMTEGIGFLNGLALRWLRDTLFNGAPAADGMDPYAAMESLAAQVPAGADGVFALVSNVMNACEWRQAPLTFVGIDVTRPGHCGERGRGLLVRAAQESAAFTALAHYRILEELSGESASELAFCGGASKGNLWPQIMANTFNLPVKVPLIKETTSLGAALCGLVGLGQYGSLADAATALVRWDRVLEPDRETATCYRSISAEALSLQRGLMEWVREGRLREMWRAAGVTASRSDACS
jgi:autoinducer 2 (AI-2) kinase